MSERKVLNKYYAPDFDDRFKNRPKRSREKKPKPEDKQFHVRIMAPCNMRCNTCGEYIAKAKKFNSRQETVKGETFLGLRVFRFYIRCPRCMGEIVFKTDLKNEDYELEQGATRNFQAQRFAEMQAAEEEKKREQEEADNPMLALEKRTRDSLNEMERLDALEDLRDMSKRQSTLDPTELLKLNQMNSNFALQHSHNEEIEDEEFVRSIYGRSADGKVVKRVVGFKPASQLQNSEPASSSSDESDDELDLEAKHKKLFSNKRSGAVTDTTSVTRPNHDGATTSNNLPNSLQRSDIFAKPHAVDDKSKTKSLKSVVRVVKKPENTTRLPDPFLLFDRIEAPVKNMPASKADTHSVIRYTVYPSSSETAGSTESRARRTEQRDEVNDEAHVHLPVTSIAGLANYDSGDESN